jgi:glycosyltransferase involved in cell wall biosynthesis
MTNPQLFIGMPVYNGESFIEQALNSLVAQTYRNWTLLISDNASTDRTAKICESFCKVDTRIRYYKQPQNQGAVKNFQYVLAHADARYFAWAASDDLWESRFLESCIDSLEKIPDAGLAFSNIVNVDSFGQVIREYPSFKPFAHHDRSIAIANYVLAPEFLGKANLFYSVYKLDLAKDYLFSFFSSNATDHFAFDMSFILGALCRFRLALDERTLFKKRLARPADEQGKPDPISIGLPYLSFLLRAEQDLYFDDMRSFSSGTPYAELVTSLLQYRANLNWELEEAQKNAMKSPMNKAISVLRQIKKSLKKRK